jgi:hypothetical protein
MKTVVWTFTRDVFRIGNEPFFSFFFFLSVVVSTKYFSCGWSLDCLEKKRISSGSLFLVFIKFVCYLQSAPYIFVFPVVFIFVLIWIYVGLVSFQNSYWDR